MYALPSLSLQRKQLDELNVWWNSLICRIFSFKCTTSVKEVLYGFGRLNIKHLAVLWYGGNVTSAGWQVTLCDPIWHVSSRSGAELVAQTAIRFLTLPYLT